MAKNPLLRLPINAQLVSNLLRSTKALLWKGARIIIFFQPPKLNKCCLGVELDPAHQVIKKLKMDHLWVYTLYPTSCPTATECDKKKKNK